MLSRTERALNDAVERTQKTNAEVEILQKQNEQLSVEFSSPFSFKHVESLAMAVKCGKDPLIKKAFSW